MEDSKEGGLWQTANEHKTGLWLNQPTYRRPQFQFRREETGTKSEEEQRQTVIIALAQTVVQARASYITLWASVFHLYNGNIECCEDDGCSTIIKSLSMTNWWMLLPASPLR